MGVLCDPSVEQRSRPDSCQQTTPFSKSSIDVDKIYIP